VQTSLENYKHLLTVASVQSSLEHYKHLLIVASVPGHHLTDSVTTLSHYAGDV